MKISKLKFTVHLLAAIFRLTIGSHYEQKVLLLKHLLNEDRYNPGTLPTINHNDSLKMSLSVELGDYIEVYEASQNVKVDLWLNLSWTDSLLSWNQSEYDDIPDMRVDVNKIWHPEIKINFVPDHHTNLLHESAQAIVNSDGAVKAMIQTDITFRCDLIISKFPFDQQTCSFYIFIQNVFPSEAFFETCNSTLRRISAGEWDILSHQVTKTKVSTSVAMTVDMKRKATYYFTTIMLPLIATAILNPVVLLIPVNSGERITAAITINLSYSVFLTLINSVLPRTSSSTSILSVYSGIIEILSGTYILVSIIRERRNKYIWLIIENRKRKSARVLPDEKPHLQGISTGNDSNVQHDSEELKAAKLDWYLFVVFEIIVVTVTLSVIAYFAL